MTDESGRCADGVNNGRPLRMDQYRAEWADASDTAKWLRDELFVGETLVFPSGSFPYGDVHADLDDSLEPDIIADLRDPPFGRDSFDTIYVDPPFGLWGSGGWLQDLWRASSERLICQTGLQKVTIPDHNPTFYVPRPVGPGISLKIFQVFDRKDHRLEEFSNSSCPSCGGVVSCQMTCPDCGKQGPTRGDR